MTYNEIMEMELDNLAATCKKLDLSSLIKLSNRFYDLYYEKRFEYDHVVLYGDEYSIKLHLKQKHREINLIEEKYNITVLEIGEKYLRQIGITDKLVLATYKRDFLLMSSKKYTIDGLKCKQLIKITEKGMNTLFCMKKYILTGIANQKAIFSHKDVTDRDVLKCVSATAHLILRPDKKQNPLY